MFQEHRISSANIRRKKKNTPLFICKARCKFEDCTVEAILEMRKEGVVDVQYKGKIGIKHHMNTRGQLEGQRETD